MAKLPFEKANVQPKKDMEGRGPARGHRIVFEGNRDELVLREDGVIVAPEYGTTESTEVVLEAGIARLLRIAEGGS